jgi:hypothetical protein
MKYFEKVGKDERPEAGLWGRNIAYSRATRGGKGGSINSREFIVGNLKNQLKGSLVGAGLGAIPGAAAGALMKGPKARNIGIGALLSGGTGSLIGKFVGDYKHKKRFAKDHGMEYGFWGVKNMTPEAKKKYLSDKYRGGGYNTEKKANVLGQAARRLGGKLLNFANKKGIVSNKGYSKLHGSLDKVVNNPTKANIRTGLNRLNKEVYQGSKLQKGLKHPATTGAAGAVATDQILN